MPLPLLLRALLLALLLGTGGSARAQTADEVEREVGRAPKQALARVGKVLNDLPLGSPERARWLAIGAEASYSLALPDRALEMARKGLAEPGISAELQQRLAIAHAQALDLAGKSQQSRDELMTVVATLEKGQFDRQFLVDALTARAAAFYSLNDFRASLADLLRAYPLAPEDGPRTVRSDVASALGNVYTAIKDYDNAKQFYQQTIDHAVAQEAWVRASIAEYSLAGVHRRQKDWDQAAYWFAQSLKHSELADDQQGVAYAEFGLGRVALERDELDVAEQAFRKSLPIFVEAGDLVPQANIAYGLAYVAFKRGQHVEASQGVAKALDLLSQYGEDLELKQKVLELKADVEFGTDRPAAAYHTLKQLIAVQERHAEARLNDTLSELRVRFDTERQAQQNALLLKENQLNAATLAEQRQTARLYVVSVVGLLVILGFLVFMAHRSKQVRRRLAEQALTDELTGVANRRHAMAVLAAEFERARRYRTPLAIAVLDLDRFKQINDGYGHDAGDQVLKLFASTHAGSLRKSDCFGRMGGEEFIAVMPHTDSAMATEVMERARNATLKLECPKLRGEVQPSVSIGVAVLESADSDVDQLVKRADEAVYRAKQAGRNRVVLAATDDSVAV